MELARKKNRKSRTLRAADWDKQKDTIQTLFLTEDRPLREVRQTLAEKHGFEASERQYKSQFETWGWRKNIPNVHMARMVKIRDRRRAEGKETCFSVGGFDVDPERIDRYAKRSSQKDESEQADAPPPEIKFRTPLGTPKLGEFQENSASVVRHATSDLDIFDQELFKHKNTIGVQASADVMAEPDAFDSEPAWLCDNSGAPASAPMVKSADLDSEDSSQGTWSSKRRKMNNARTAKSLSCPFRKRNPSRFNIRDHIACANTSFTDLSQVKKHVRIYHAPPKADGVERDDPEDGISREIETVLLSRKSTVKLDSWANMWGVLFPQDGTNPPPDFQPPIEVEEITHSLLTSVKDLKPAIQGVIDDQTPDSDEMTDRIAMIIETHIRRRVLEYKEQARMERVSSTRMRPRSRPKPPPAKGLQAPKIRVTTDLDQPEITVTDYTLSPSPRHLLPQHTRSRANSASSFRSASSHLGSSQFLSPKAALNGQGSRCEDHVSPHEQHLAIGSASASMDPMGSSPLPSTSQHSDYGYSPIGPITPTSECWPDWFDFTCFYYSASSNPPTLPPPQFMPLDIGAAADATQVPTLDQTRQQT